MSKSQKKDLFDRIAWPYGLFFHKQVKMYKSILQETQFKQRFLEVHSICDVGCGTGALAAVLHMNGYKVTAIDQSAAMLTIAKGKTDHLDIQYTQGSVLDLPYISDSFDIVIASYVAHGLKKTQRLVMMEQMKSVAKKAVVLIDFNQTRRWHTDVIEWLEQGDYFNFIYDIEDEMNAIFSSVEIIPAFKYGNIYIGYCETIK